VDSDAKNSCDVAKVLQLEVLMELLLEEFDVIEMSNEDEVINIDGEDDSAIPHIEMECAVHFAHRAHCACLIDDSGRCMDWRAQTRSPGQEGSG